MNRVAVTPTFQSARSRRLENRRYEAAPIHGTYARPMWEVEAPREPFFSQVLPCSSSSFVLVLESSLRQKIEREDEGRGRTRLAGS
jgi:hypothetical protein